MRILTTLDYEVFLGDETGSVKNNLIIPMNKLTSVGNNYGIKCSLFVDASYLYMLKKLGNKHLKLKNDYNNICANLNKLSNEGHDIELHIHPHWFFSTFNGNKWITDSSHYKLSDLKKEEAEEIFSKSKKLLEEITGKKIIAFRAGGFSAQPTDLLTHLFRKNNIKADCSVYTGAYYNSQSQQYDYRKTCNKELYTFSNDICKEDLNGDFTEIPISTLKISPCFYWKLASRKLIGINSDMKWGDGISVSTSYESIINRLTMKSNAMATIDGYKISYLTRLCDIRKKEGMSLTTIIGHPKLATPYSVKKFTDFCKLYSHDDNFVTIKDLL